MSAPVDEKRLRDALEEIASYDRGDGVCRCGHKMDFCHVANADIWCGGGLRIIALHGLGKCPRVCWPCIRDEQAIARASSETDGA